LLANGRDLASEGDWKSAEARFHEALGLNSQHLQFRSREAAQHLAGFALVAKAENLARRGDVKGATATFSLAKSLDQDIDVNPVMEVNKWVAENLVLRGVSYSEMGDMAGANIAFKAAAQLDPSRVSNSGSYLYKMGSQVLRQAANMQAASGDLTGAKQTYKWLLDNFPTLDLDPSVEPIKQSVLWPLAKGQQLLRQHRLADAKLVFSQMSSNFSEAMPSLPAGSFVFTDLNLICWYGSLTGHAGQVMNACDKAIETAGKFGNILDSRGVARALTGNTAGAIEDFQLYVKQRPDNDDRRKRQSWIDELSQGEQPFTQTVLDALLSGS
jgi:tetratricopeptide (TPR) repeat protein